MLYILDLPHYFLVVSFYLFLYALQFLKSELNPDYISALEGVGVHG